MVIALEEEVLTISFERQPSNIREIETTYDDGKEVITASYIFEYKRRKITGVYSAPKSANQDLQQRLLEVTMNTLIKILTNYSRKISFNHIHSLQPKEELLKNKLIKEGYQLLDKNKMSTRLVKQY